MRNLNKEAYPMGNFRKIMTDQLMFTSIQNDIHNVVQEIWNKAKNNIGFYDVGESFIGYTKDELKEFVTAEVTKHYDAQGVHYEL